LDLLYTSEFPPFLDSQNFQQREIDFLDRGGSTAKLQIFLVVSTCLLYLVAAGLFTRAISAFEAQQWAHAIGGDAAETGVGAGSYDIGKSVWHVNVSSSTMRLVELS
jgi:high-affinity Fe2+/Pb2+ permease